MSYNKFGDSTLPGDEISQKGSPGRQNVRSGVGKAKNRGWSLSKRDVRCSPFHLTSSWTPRDLSNISEYEYDSDHYLTPLLLQLNNIQKHTQEPSQKVSQDVIKRSRDGNRRVVKTSVTEPDTTGNNSRKKKSSTGKKSVKDEIMSNPVLDAQVENILSFMQDNY